jgi:hypothetical protein
MPDDLDALNDLSPTSVVDHLVITDLETGEILVNRGGGNAVRRHQGGLETGSPG